MKLDEHIFEAVAGHTRSDPQTLPGIIAHVDARMKLMMTHEELAGALQRLTSSGRVEEIARHRFIESGSDANSRVFSGITIDEQRDAEEAYRKAFWQAYRKLKKT